MKREQGKMILLVDNDPSVIAALEARLSGMGYRCRTSSCGSEALEHFRQQPPDLVISDLNMPLGDGAGLAASIRQHSNVPIILISGFKDAYRKTLRGIPDISFLHKPFNTEDLLALVEASIVNGDESKKQFPNAA